MSAVTARWDGFLAQIRDRFSTIMGEAREGCPMVLEQADFDPTPMGVAWGAIEMRAKQLETKIEDTWNDQVEGAFENDGAPDSGLELGRMVTRDRGYPLIFSVNPRVDAYPGKVAVLVDGCSVSTSEIMAGGLRDLGRARVFGTRTAGAALPSVIERLPNGDAFQYAIANYISKSGEVLEGRGVEPQEVVELSREALLDGRDNVIEAAVHWIRAE